MLLYHRFFFMTNIPSSISTDTDPHQRMKSQSSSSSSSLEDCMITGSLGFVMGAVLSYSLFSQRIIRNTPATSFSSSLPPTQRIVVVSLISGTMFGLWIGGKNFLGNENDTTKRIQQQQQQLSSSSKTLVSEPQPTLEDRVRNRILRRETLHNSMTHSRGLNDAHGGRWVD
jgi:hypothetical protein